MPTPMLPERLPILATAVTPWTADWRFDAARFGQQVRAIARELTRRIYIFGTAGEGHAVSDAQFREIAASFLTVARAEGVTPMIGVISMSLPTAVARIAWAREQGCREFQVSLPSWGPLNDRELDDFFAETCGRFADCRFLHYNLQRAGRLLTAADYRRLAEAHPNLVAVKSSASDPAIIREFMALRPRLEFFFNERGYPEARRLGDCGYLISIGAVHPARTREYVAADDARRAELFEGILAMSRTLRELAAGRWHMDGAYDKLLHKVSDPEFPLRLLPPYQGATEEDWAAFRVAIPSEWRRERAQ